MVKLTYKSNFKVNNKFENEENYVCVGVFDKIKIKLEANNKFPIDIKCTLLVTDEDHEEYLII